MDPTEIAEKMMLEALQDGTLDPTAHAGQPLPEMRANDPGWWIRSFLERDALPERLAEARATAARLLDSAVSVDDLTAARAVLAQRNAGVRRWNAEVPDTHRLRVVTEPQLLEMRANARIPQRRRSD